MSPRILPAACEIDRHAAEKNDIDAGGGELARGVQAHVIGLIDLPRARLGHAQRGDDERHAGRNELVELIGKISAMRGGQV
jgi:hypothetical protein